MKRSQYDHEPQNYKVAANLRTARLAEDAERGEDVVQESVSSRRAGALVGATAGLQHGALARVRVHNVAVWGGQHYFCPSADYRIEELLQPGDGSPIPADIPCHIEVRRVPEDGDYDVLLQLTNNNGSIQGTVVGWFEPETKDRVRALRRVEGAVLVD